MNCKDTNCYAKAKYNLNTKEINILSEHTKKIENHSYISYSSHYSTIDSIIYMKNNPNIKGIEIMKK